MTRHRLDRLISPGPEAIKTLPDRFSRNLYPVVPLAGLIDIDYPADGFEMSHLQQGEGADIDSQSVMSRDMVGLYLDSLGNKRPPTPDQQIELSKRVRAGADAAKALGDGVGIRKSARLKLQAAIQDGKLAASEQAVANLGLVVSIAKQYRGRGLEYLDLIQHGSLGLMRSIESFDLNNGAAFSTLATRKIKSTILRALANESRAVRLPIYQYEKMPSFARAKRELTQELGGSPTPAQIADKLGIPVEEVIQFLVDWRDPLSLDEDKIDGGETLDNIVQAPSTASRLPSPDTVAKLDAVLSHLDPDERLLVEQYYGVGGLRVPADELAAERGLAKNTIQQRARDLVAKLALRVASHQLEVQVQAEEIEEAVEQELPAA